MLGSTLALALALVGSTPTLDPSALVLQLGSPRYELRESAEAELRKLGRMSLPALRAAKHFKDPEIRLRAAATTMRIEQSLLVEPTPIALDFRDVPLAQVVRQINAQTGLNLGLAPGESQTLADRRVTIQSGEPLPFWKAIDALCVGAQVHLIEAVQAGFGQRDGLFLFKDGFINSTGARSDTGPFRVYLSSVHYQSEVQLNQLRSNSPTNRMNPPVSHDDHAPLPTLPTRQFFLQIMVLTEPRLSITQNGAIQVSTAVDNRGQSLLPRQNLGPFHHSAGYFGMNPAPLVRLRIDLDYPQGAGDRIRLIQGKVPVVVATRKPDPLEVPLKDTGEQSYQNEDVVLTLGTFRPAQNKQPSTIELTIKPLTPGIPPLDGGVGEPLAYRADSPQQQIEILDSEGTVVPWFPSATFYNGEETRMTLTLNSKGRVLIPAKVRYHGIIRSATEIPFEFRDIPMP